MNEHTYFWVIETMITPLTNGMPDEKIVGYFTMKNPNNWSPLIHDAQPFRSKGFAESVAFEWDIKSYDINEYGLMDANEN